MTLDGLRGYLAFFVFLNHAIHWFIYLQDGTWIVPTDGSALDQKFGLYYQMGSTSVNMFFMITGFLFTSKLLNEREKGVDWIKLYTSRVLRIVPLYLFAMFILFSLVLIESDFRLAVPLKDLSQSLLHWLGFTIIDMPKINGIQAGYISTSVTWTLAYEWIFYLSLPMLALLLRGKVSMALVIISLLTVSTLIINKADFFFPLVFVSGIVTAIVYRIEAIRALMQHWIFSILAICLILFLFFYQHDIRKGLELILISIAFGIIACGNHLFGILSNATSRLLGEISYGIYLLHGLLLSSVLKYVIGFERIKELDMLTYGVLTCTIASALILISSFTYRWIEKPAMKQVSSVTSLIKRNLIDSLKLDALISQQAHVYKA